MRPAGRHQLTSASHVSITSWNGLQLSSRVDEAMRIYTDAMEYPGYVGAQRGVTVRQHVSIPGFACRAALTGDGTLVGFGYGYTTMRGQWWHDRVRNALRRADQAWLDDAFELSEMHVLPEWQGMQIGRRLITELAAGIPHSSMLLSTPDADTRAFRLYRKVGFLDLVRGYLFPGDARPFAVLGAPLPLTPGP